MVQKAASVIALRVVTSNFSVGEVESRNADHIAGVQLSHPQILANNGH